MALLGCLCALVAPGLRDVPELRQTISVRRPDAPISEIVEDIERQTGVSIRADKTLLNDKATVLIRSQPAYEVLEKMAETLRLEWVHNRSDWVIRRSPAQLRLEANLRRMEEDRMVMKIKNRVLAVLPYCKLTLKESEAKLDAAQRECSDKDFVKAYYKLLDKYPGLGDATVTLNRIIALNFRHAGDGVWRTLVRGGKWAGTYPGGGISDEAWDFMVSMDAWESLREDTEFERTTPTRGALTISLDYMGQVRTQITLANNQKTVTWNCGDTFTPYFFDSLVRDEPAVKACEAWTSPGEELNKTVDRFDPARTVHPEASGWISVFDQGGPNIVASYLRLTDKYGPLSLSSLVWNGFTRLEGTYILSYRRDFWKYGPRSDGPLQ